MEIRDDGYYILTEEEKERMREKAKGRSLAEMNPELAEQWNPTLNGDLDPTMVMANSHKKVWWICPYDDPKTGKHFDFSWKMAISERNFRNKGCPYLSGKAIWVGFNDLATTHPILAKQWNYKRNGNLKPTDVTYGSHKKVWWYVLHYDKFLNRFFLLEWDAIIYNRSLRINDNPYLAGKKVLKGFNDLATMNPDVAKDWHPTKNGDLKPTDVAANSHRKVWWQKSFVDLWTGQIVTHEWLSIIGERNDGDDCPYINTSKAERLLYDILATHNFQIKYSQSFANCKYKNKLPFDFYLPTENILIETDGEQHFMSKSCWGGDIEFENLKIRDNLKTNYCFDNNIPLLRIPYIYDPNKDRNKIEQLILDFIQTKQVPQEIIDFYSQFDFSDYGKILQKQNP